MEDVTINYEIEAKEPSLSLMLALKFIYLFLFYTGLLLLVSGILWVIYVVPDLELDVKDISHLITYDSGLSFSILLLILARFIIFYKVRTSTIMKVVINFCSVIFLYGVAYYLDVVLPGIQLSEFSEASLVVMFITVIYIASLLKRLVKSSLFTLA